MRFSLQTGKQPSRLPWDSKKTGEMPERIVPVPVPAKDSADPCPLPAQLSLSQKENGEFAHTVTLYRDRALKEPLYQAASYPYYAYLSVQVLDVACQLDERGAALPGTTVYQVKLTAENVKNTYCSNLEVPGAKKGVSLLGWDVKAKVWRKPGEKGYPDFPERGAGLLDECLCALRFGGDEAYAHPGQLYLPFYPHGGRAHFRRTPLLRLGTVLRPFFLCRPHSEKTPLYCNPSRKRSSFRQHRRAGTKADRGGLLIRGSMLYQIDAATLQAQGAALPKVPAGLYWVEIVRVMAEDVTAESPTLAKE